MSPRVIEEARNPRRKVYRHRCSTCGRLVQWEAQEMETDQRGALYLTCPPPCAEFIDPKACDFVCASEEPRPSAPEGYTDASAPIEWAETGCDFPRCEYGMGHIGPHGRRT